MFIWPFFRGSNKDILININLSSHYLHRLKKIVGIVALHFWCLWRIWLNMVFINMVKTLIIFISCSAISIHIKISWECNSIYKLYICIDYLSRTSNFEGGESIKKIKEIKFPWVCWHLLVRLYIGKELEIVCWITTKHSTTFTVRTHRFFSYVHERHIYFYRRVMPVS